MQNNPYTTPQSRLRDGGEELPVDAIQFRPATRRQRILTQVVDLGCFYVLFVIFRQVLFIIGMAANESMANLYQLFGYHVLSFIVLLFLYYLLLEYVWQVTPGKLVLHTRVVKSNGESPTFIQIVLRSLCRFIPFEFVSFLPVQGRTQAYLQQQPVGWHDRFSDTCVADTRTI